MRRLSRVLLALVVVLVMVAAGLYVARNPEHDELDDAARRAAGGRYVRLADGVTHYELTGPDTGRIAVLVHGFSVPLYIWDSTAAALGRAGFRVLRYDLYGRGYSDRPNVPYSLDLFDRQLVGLLDSLHVRDRIDLAGLSMGGPVVATFAARHRERLRTLTLVDPAAGAAGKVPLVLRIPGLRTWFWQTFAVPGMAEGQRSDFVEPARFPDWADRYRPQMRYLGFGRALLSTTLESAKVNRDTVYAATGRSGVPTLLIWGTEDHTVPFALSASVRRAVPQAEFHAIAHAGHLPIVERAGETNRLIVEWLRAH